MSPEEWAQKIADLIDEAECDLNFIPTGEWWGVDYSGGDLTLRRYVQGIEVRSDRIYIF